MTVTACETASSSRPIPQQYSKQEQTALANELDEKCPLYKDSFGNETHSCPMIDKVISDYRALRKKLNL